MKQIYNIEDIDLTDREMLKTCVANWYTIEELSETHTKALDLFIELKDRWNSAHLSDIQKKAIHSILVNEDTKREVSRDYNISYDEMKRHAESGISEMCLDGDDVR